MRLCVGGEVAVRHLGVARARAIADVERGCGHTVRAASRALYGAARLSGCLRGVVHADPARGSATPVALGFEQGEAQAVRVCADDAVVYAGAAAHVKRGSGHRVGAADAIALGAVVARRCLGLGSPLLHGATSLASAHVIANSGLELVPALAVLHEEGVATLPVAGGKWFNEMHVGTHMLNYDSMLTLTHFKGHTMGGFGGSNKNLGIGCADGRIGKGEIHTVPGSDNLWSIAEEELMERMTESTKATIDFFGDNIVYVNVMRNMSVSCDCEGTGAMPVVTPNVGILASTDICAIDVACVDLVYAMTEAELCDNRDLVERIETRHGLRQLSYMHELGMGNWKYRLLDLDNGEAEITQAEAVAHVTPFEG